MAAVIWSLFFFGFAAMLRRDINTAIAPHLMSYTARPFYFIRCVSAKRGLLVSDLTRVQYIYFQKALHICIPPAPAPPLWFPGCSLAHVVFSLIKEISRLPSNLVVMGTRITWPKVRQTLDVRESALRRASVPPLNSSVMVTKETGLWDRKLRGGVHPCLFV